MKINYIIPTLYSNNAVSPLRKDYRQSNEIVESLNPENSLFRKKLIKKTITLYNMQRLGIIPKVGLLFGQSENQPNPSVNLEGTAFDLWADAVTTSVIQEVDIKTGEENTNYVQIRTGSPTNVFPVAQNKLTPVVTLQGINFFRVEFTLNNLQNANNKKSHQLVFWLQVSVTQSINVTQGQIVEKVVELLGLPFLSLLSSEMIMRGVSLKIFSVPENTAVGSIIDTENLSLQNEILYPLSLRGKIKGVKANENSFDIDLYLEGMQDKRFNRLSVVGVGAKNNDVFFERDTFMARTFGYIRRLFLSTVTLTIPRQGNPNTVSARFRLYDRFYSTTKISPVEAFSFGGFKKTASSKLREQLAELKQIPNKSNNEEA